MRKIKMAETVAERVVRVFAEFKKISPDEVKMETTFEEMGLDSLDGLNLIFELEEEFDLTVPDNQIQEMKSVAQVVAGIEMLLEAKAQGIDVTAEAAKEFAAQQAAIKAQKVAAKAGTAEETKAEDAPAEAEAEKAEETPVEAEKTNETPKKAKPRKKPSAK